MVSMKNPPHLLQRDLAHATDYATWREIALELDHREGHDVWRAEDACDGYDHWLIKERLLELRRMRRDNDVRRLGFRLHETTCFRGFHVKHDNLHLNKNNGK